MSWPTPRGGTGWGASPPPGDAPPGWSASSEAERRRGRWWLVSIVLIVAAAAALTVGLSRQQPLLGGPLVATGKPASGALGVRPTARSVPLTLSIPAIGLSVPLSELGLNANHTVQVPGNFAEPGWYKFGPSPGQTGSSVILGHLDSYQGPAVFFRLRSLRPGDHVDVSLTDGVITHFVVRQIAMYPKASFPTLQVYGSHGYSALQLVTCGGVFDTQTRSYLSNVVVYTSMVWVSRR